MVYRFIDDNKNIFGLRWLCNKFGISPNCYYNYKKEAKQKYHERLAHIFELIKYVYYKDKEITVGFDNVLLNKNVFYDSQKKQLTFKNLPKGLVDELEK